MTDIPIRKISGTPDELNASATFNIRDVATLLSGKDMVQQLHRHDFFYVLVLKKGVGTHEIDFANYSISDGTIFLMRPGQVHQLHLKAGATGYLLEFKVDFHGSFQGPFRDLLRKVTGQHLYHFEAAQLNKLLALLTFIFEEYTSQQEGYLEVIKANLEIFFIHLLRYRQNNKNVDPQRTPYAQERLEEFLELLESHVSTHKLVSEYADMLSLSTYQLNAITKTMVGKTCSEVIDDYIILESKRYLLATSDLVSQIAFRLGYEDVSYFIRFFKKQTGSTPENFRKNYR